MLSRAHPGQKNSSRWMQSGWLRLCRMTWAIAGALLMGPLRSRVLVGACLGRGEELGDDLDGQDALDPPLVIRHRRVLRLGLQQVCEGVAQHVIGVEERLR